MRTVDTKMKTLLRNKKKLKLTPVTTEQVREVVKKMKPSKSLDTDGLQVIKYLEENKLINDTIHGYRTEHSCETSILEMLNEAVTSHEEGTYFGLCMYDQSAAFDLVNYSIFLRKLEILG